MKLLTVLALGAALAWPWTYQRAYADPDQLSGCLTRGGSLARVAPGDQPARPCRANQIEVTIGIASDEHSPQQDAVLIPFSIRLGLGSEEDIAVRGPLRIYVRCEDAPDDRVRVTVRATSTADGWLFPGNVPEIPAVAGDEALLAVTEDGLGLPRYSRAHGNSVTAPDGSFMALGATGLGVNVFGHDCIAAGTLTAAPGEPD